MTKTLGKKVRHEIEDALDDAAKDLKRAAEDLGDDAEQAIAQAAEALRRAAESIAEKAVPQVRDLVEKAGPAARDVACRAEREIREHPIATTVAALSAAAALIQLLGDRRKKAA